MNFKTINSYWCAALIVAILGFASSLTEAKNQKDGKFAQKLDEYSSTLKCMLNIAEETLPELDDFMLCCGFWAIHDFIIHKVDDECEPENLVQVKHMAGLAVPKMREHCREYEHGSFTCRLLVIMPVAFVIIFILLILGVCVCSCVSFYKWTAVRRKYLRVVNLNTGHAALTLKNNLSKGTGKYADEP